MPTGRIGRATRAREGVATARRGRPPRFARWRVPPVTAKGAISLNFRVYLTPGRAVATYDTSESVRRIYRNFRGGFSYPPSGAHGSLRGTTIRISGHDQRKAKAPSHPRREPGLPSAAVARHRRLPAHDRAAFRRARKIDQGAGRGDALRHVHPAGHAEERLR